MSVRKTQNHMVDFLFPVALFFIFAVSALSVLLLATGVYQSTAANSARNDTARTCVSYISEKVHQNDRAGEVYLGSFDGCDALVMRQTLDNEVCYTYIYACDGELKELFIKEGVDAAASAGKTITSVEDFSMQELGEGLFRFSCTDEHGETVSSVVGLHTRKG